MPHLPSTTAMAIATPWAGVAGTQQGLSTPYPYTWWWGSTSWDTVCTGSLVASPPT
jgi:hypothetical protein